jgi:hypothetical protein
MKVSGRLPFAHCFLIEISRTPFPCEFFSSFLGLFPLPLFPVTRIFPNESSTGQYATFAIFLDGELAKILQKKAQK